MSNRGSASNKADKQRYMEAREKEAVRKSNELAGQIESLQYILKHTLKVNDVITFESLRSRDIYSARPIPSELLTAKPVPNKEQFLAQVKPMSFLENALGQKGRYERDIQAVEEQYAAALRSYQAAENERQRRLTDFLAQDKAAEQDFTSKVQQRNQKVDEVEARYKAGDAPAVIAYNNMVLERSEYPKGFPQKFRLAYRNVSRGLRHSATEIRVQDSRYHHFCP